jgi:hypothetical protein
MFAAFLAASLYFHFATGSGLEAPAFDSRGLNVLLIVVQMALPVPVHAALFVLGVVALFFPRRKKLFPILAVALNLVFGLLSLFPWVRLALHAPGVK